MTGRADGDGVPRRVPVRARRNPRAAEHREVLADVDQGTRLGDTVTDALVRAQLRLSARLLAAVGALVAALPLLLATLPGLRSATVGGLPVVWLLLGVLAYPVLGVAGWAHVRLSERLERDFSDVLGGDER